MSYHIHQSNGHNYSEEEKKIIYSYYQKNKGKTGWLNDLAKEINRSKANICRFARSNKLTNKNRRSYQQNVCTSCGMVFITPSGVSRKSCSKECLKKIIYLYRSKFFKELHKKRGHPRGMLNKHQNENMRKKTSIRMKIAWADKNSIFNSKEHKQKRSEYQSKVMIERLKKFPSNVYSRTTKGWRDFLGNKRYFMRSKWEMNYGHYLDWLQKMKQISNWLYEEDTFWFEKIKRGVRSYTPDFKIFNNDGSIEYHEVKGWMDNKSKTKLKRMKIYHPEIKILLIDEDQYKALKKQSKLFGWE